MSDPDDQEGIVVVDDAAVSALRRRDGPVHSPGYSREPVPASRRRQREGRHETHALVPDGGELVSLEREHEKLGPTPAYPREPNVAIYHVNSPSALREQEAAWAGRKGGLLWAVSAADGKPIAQHTLASPPAWDGLAAAHGRLYLSTTDGKVICLQGAP